MKSEEKSVMNEGDQDQEAEDSKEDGYSEDPDNEQDLNSEASENQEDEGYKKHVDNDIIEQDMPHDEN